MSCRTASLFLLFATLVPVPAVSAQASNPKGALAASALAPAQGNDSIHLRAVDGADYRGHDYVYLLHEGEARVDADGRETYTERQTTQVLTRAGADQWGELAFGYSPERQTFKLNWLRVLRPDGTVVGEGPEHQQESSPGVQEGAPIYTDQKLIQMTVGGVAPGTIVDYSYTLETTDPHLPGDVWFHWGLNGLTPIMETRFTLDTPVDMEMRVRESNLMDEASDAVSEGRRVRYWEAKDVEALKLQGYAAFPNDLIRSVSISGGIDWDDVGAWYAPQADGRYALTPEIEAAHDAQLVGAVSLEDSLRVTHRWVAQDFRYVSLALGDGAYQPRFPAEVFETGFGDCKDKASLFIGLARRMGLDARPVLVSSEGGVNRDAPSLKQFDHMIAAVVTDGTSQFFDLTSALTPFGELPPGLQGDVGILMDPEGRSEVVDLPEDQPDANRWEQVVTGSIDRDNTFVGSVTLSATGTEQYTLRQAFSNFAQQDDENQSSVMDQIARNTTWTGAVVDSSEVSEGLDWSAPARVKIWFHAPNVLGGDGSSYTLNLPLIHFGDATLALELEAQGERVFPIDIGQVNSPSVYVSQLDVTLPEGWKAAMPADHAVEGTFGKYTADYRQIGSKFSIERVMVGRSGVAPADSIGALKSWITSVSEDDTGSLTISSGATQGLIAEGDEIESGRLPGILLSEDDLPDGAVMASEGGKGEALIGLTSNDPIESFSRVFGAEDVVFNVGDSPIVYLTVAAATFETQSEALRELQYLDLIDVPTLVGAGMDNEGAGPSFGDQRETNLGDIGDARAGWVVEMVSPLSTLDLGIALFTRGRVQVSTMIVSAKGLQDDDIASLLRPIDERLLEDVCYNEDLAEMLAKDEDENAFSLLDSVGVALEDIPLNENHYVGTTESDPEFSRVGDIADYKVTLQGRTLTFPTATSDAISIETEVLMYPAPADAVKALMQAERQDLEGYLRQILDGESMLVDAVLEGDSASFQMLERPLGVLSLARAGTLRGVLRWDVDDVMFVRDRFFTVVTVTSLPDEGSPRDATEVARLTEERLRGVVADLPDDQPDGEWLERIRRVVNAEAVVDSLTDEREFETLFDVIDDTEIEDAPVTFTANIWNNVCWWASLNGHAERALAACDAAIEIDPTSVTRLDSRALARALAGDTEGAIEDFNYIVENAPDGVFLDTRAGFLEMLKAGENPFTSEELERLKNEG